MIACKQCASHAINHHLYGRDGTDADLCDVCYWRKRADGMPELLEACKTFSEWLRHDDDGPVYTQGGRGAEGGEAIWREWWEANLELCRKSQILARAAIAKATGEQQ